MRTTNLFVEIIVIGVGCFTWMFTLILYIIGFPEVTIPSINSIFLLIPMTSLIYVLGIIWDRFTDLLTDVIDKPIKKRFFKDKDDYHNAKDKVYSLEGSVINLFEYTRSRMRICRSWTIDFLILSIIFISFFENDLIENKSIVGFNILKYWFFPILFLLTFYSWIKLTITYYQRLQSTFVSS